MIRLKPVASLVTWSATTPSLVATSSVAFDTSIPTPMPLAMLHLPGDGELPGGCACGSYLYVRAPCGLHQPFELWRSRREACVRAPSRPRVYGALGVERTPCLPPAHRSSTRGVTHKGVAMETGAEQFLHRSLIYWRSSDQSMGKLSNGQ